jgi:acyl-coenzyme A synthetase/AMP-(fatty) acid ligase
LHLRALAQAEEVLRDCGLVLASTMPLESILAAQVESLTNAPVLEIYGSTETGVMAMRRTAHETDWRCVEGVRIETSATEARAWGEHFSSPHLLADDVKLNTDGALKLVGRRGDMVKIAGRRASLAGLNLLLREVPGLADAVFYMPATGLPTERLVLIYAGEPVDRDATLRCLRERMDPVFLPRTIIRVDRLPRSETGKLPRAALDAIYAARGLPKASR